jgi:thiol-disulfide isomerase/thioredoxin
MTASAYSSDREQNTKEDKTVTQETKQAAVEFDPELPWLNVSRPLVLDDLKGKVVILDFWTYGCINCIHVLADLKKLEEKYGDRLAVIGVHTPKFENEENIETLRNIIVRYGINHPVVHDVDSVLGRIYGMRAWPTQVMIDPEGFILGSVTGENHYELFDELISELIEEHHDIMDPSPLPLALEKDKFASSLLAAPGKIAVSDSHVAISDTLHHRVILADHNGRIQAIYGGPDADLEDGDAESTRFHSPQGLAFSDRGLFVADTGNHVIRYIDLSNGQVQTIAGTGKIERHRSGEFDALSVGLASPWGLAFRGSMLYVAMAGSHQIWRYDAAKGNIGPWAGSGREGIRDGHIKVSTFSQPSGLSIDGDWLYVADSEASAVRRIHLSKERVETLVGTGLFDFGDRNGPFDQAQLQHVLGVAALNPSEVLIVDTYNHKLKSLDLETGVVVSLAGDGQPGKTVSNSGKAQLNEPGGLAIFGQQVLIADTNNHRILVYDLNTKQTQEWMLIPAESAQEHLD